MTQEVKLKRSQCNFQAENARFLLECDFSKQYSHYYRKRLERTRPFIEFNSRSRWNADIPIYSLAELASAIPLGDLLDSPPISLKTENDSQDVNRRFSLSLSCESPSSANMSSFEFAKRLRSDGHGKPESPLVSSTQRQDHENRPSPLVEPSESPILTIQRQTKSEEKKDKSRGSCIIIGTIFKRMKMQPDVVEELSRGDFHVKCERYLGHYANPEDKLVLEDSEESIALAGNIKPGDFVTGVVVALLGHPSEDCDQFFVKDICFAEPNRQLLYDFDEELDKSQPAPEVTPIIRSPTTNEPIYLLVVSGLGFTHDMEKQVGLTKALQNLIDFVWGGGKYDNDDRSSKVSRILIVGDNLSSDRSLVESEVSPVDCNLNVAGPSRGSSDNDILTDKMRRSRQVKPYSESVDAIKHLDSFFAELSKTIAVDVMPGYSDPSSHLMPQQPFHPCMFPKSCMFALFNCTTNPFHAIYDDHVELLATSGQNVDIVTKFSSINDPIDVMKKHLLWGSSAPSAPDNLYSVPYEEEDPYVIDFIPDVYIAGCQEYYKAEYYFYENSENSYGQTSQRKSVNTETPNRSEESITLKPEPNPREPPNNRDEWQPSKKDRTLLLTIPKFCETFTCVLINLKNLETQLLSFQ